MTIELIDYFSSDQLENDITVCDLCGYEIHLEEGYWQLEAHMNTKHPEKPYAKEEEN